VIEHHPQPIHLMITDVVMPGMSGQKLAERLTTITPHMKVLYMSGYTDDVVLRHGILDAGMPFINKPFAAGDLAAKIRQILDSEAALQSDT
jgi:FixJ family two-component response regulator